MEIRADFLYPWIYREKIIGITFSSKEYEGDDLFYFWLLRNEKTLIWLKFIS